MLHVSKTAKSCEEQPKGKDAWIERLGLADEF